MPQVAGCLLSEAGHGNEHTHLDSAHVSQAHSDSKYECGYRTGFA